jgi:multidrug efflux pump subunit AcrA (membrane-fusion protein)
MSQISVSPAPEVSLSERVRSLRLPDRPAVAGRSSRLPWVLCALLLCSSAYFALEASAPVDEATLQKLVDERLALGAADVIGRTTPRSTGETAAQARGTAGSDGDPIALESKGYIVPVSLIQVSPLVGGRVVKMSFKEGDTVKKGAFLAQIETTEFQSDHDRVAAQVRAAQARVHELTKYRDDEVNQAKAELDDTKAQRDQLFIDFQRSIGLRETRALAQKEYEQAEYSYKSMDQRMRRLQFAYELLRKGPRDERIAAARAEHEQYQAEQVKAKWRLDNATVSAPIDGTILSKKAEEGNFVNPSAFSNGLSASLCEMADLANMEVDLSIAERDIAKVFKGQTCRVRAEAFTNRPYQGQVSRVMPQADRAKGAVPVRVKIEIPREEAGQFLRPDMGALVTFYNDK